MVLFCWSKVIFKVKNPFQIKIIELQLLKKLRSLDISMTLNPLLVVLQQAKQPSITLRHGYLINVARTSVYHGLRPEHWQTSPKLTVYSFNYHPPTVQHPSSHKKEDKLGGVLHNNNVDIAVITETWLTAVVPQHAADIAGYCAHHRMRVQNNEKSKGGGVAIYIRDTITVQSLDIKVPVGLECIWLRATPSHLPREISTLIVAGVYHPPKAPNERELIEHIAHTVTSVKIKHPDCRVVSCGDFNKANIKPLCNKGLK